MNDTDKILDTLTTQLQQQARIEDEEAMADLIMSRIEEVEQPPRKQHILQPKWFVPLRAAAAVVTIFFIGLFLLLNVRQPDTAYPEVCYVHNMEQYQIRLSDYSSASDPRELYRCYMEERNERTFYQNEFKRLRHENL